MEKWLGWLHQKERVSTFSICCYNSKYDYTIILASASTGASDHGVKILITYEESCTPVSYKVPVGVYL